MISSIINSVQAPLISCLCITHKRPELLKNAIRCFLQQDYSNKELVVVYNCNDIQTIQALREFQSEQIRTFALDTKGQNLTIGELRNITVELSRGKFLCTWDDDDWYGVDRIKNQLSAIIKYKKKASILSHVLMYDRSKQTAYLSHSRMWEFSILFEKQAVANLGIKYRHINRAEDYFFVNDLIKENLLVPILDPTQYIYHSTGTNTCGQGHFDWLHSHSEKLSAYQTLVIQKAVNGGLDPAEAYNKMQGENFLHNFRYVPVSESRL